MPTDPNVHSIECPYCHYQQLLPDIAQRRAAVQNAQLMQQGMQLATKAADTSRRIGTVAGLIGVLLPVVIMGGVGYTLYNQGLFGNAQEASWTGTGPLVCGANQHMTVSNVTSSQPQSQVVIASQNCQLTLTNVNITGMNAIVAYGNARVTITGGSITGLGQSIVARDNATVIVAGANVVGPVIHLNNSTVAGVPGVM
jgi:hypothetical protein